MLHSPVAKKLKNPTTKYLFIVVLCGDKAFTLFQQHDKSKQLNQNLILVPIHVGQYCSLLLSFFFPKASTDFSTTEAENLSTSAPGTDSTEAPITSALLSTASEGKEEPGTAGPAAVCVLTFPHALGWGTYFIKHCRVQPFKEWLI